MSFPEQERGAYLPGLRERALARLRVEEVAAGVVEPRTAESRISRRTSLRMIGMAAAGMAAGALRARAAGVGSLRMAAPQYGAPAYSGSYLPYERRPGDRDLPSWMQPAPILADRTQLADRSLWRTYRVPVIPDDGKPHSFWDNSTFVESKYAYYKGSGGRSHALQLINDGQSTFLAPGGQTLYFRHGDELTAVLMRYEGVTMQSSLMKLEDGNRDPADREAALLAAFAKGATEKELADPAAKGEAVRGWRPDSFYREYLQASVDGRVLEVKTLRRDVGPLRFDWKSKTMLPDGEKG